MNYRIVLIVALLFAFAGISFAGEFTNSTNRYVNITCKGEGTAYAYNLSGIDPSAVSGNGTSYFVLAGNATRGEAVNQTNTGACVDISASNVVLDLNGTTIVLSGQVSGAPIIGINITNGTSNVTIVNGIINVSTTGVTEATANYVGILINGSTNITIRNVTINPMSSVDVPVTTSVGINITTSTATTSGTGGGLSAYGTVNLTRLNISNATTAGIVIENYSNVDITDAWFASGIGTWLSTAPLIMASWQNATAETNVATAMFNMSTNVTLDFYGNLSAYLQTSRPISTGPSGTAVGSSRSYLTIDKMVNLTGSTGVTVANVTLWFSSSDISPYSSGDITIHKTSDSVSWDGPHASTLDLIGSGSITATNANTFGAFALFGYTVPGQSSGSTNTPSSSKSYVATPDVEYSCTDNSLKVKTTSSVQGATVTMLYYCSPGCGSCNAPNQGSYAATVDSDGVATFDYKGQGEYQFDISGLSSDSDYRSTVWYDASWSCYKPDEACQVSEPEPEPAVAEEPVASEELPPVPPENQEEVVQPHEEVPASEPSSDAEMQTALKAISDADGAIKAAQNENKDVGAARKKLEDASAALNSKDYAQASRLANEAVSLAKSAKVAAAQAAEPEAMEEKPPAEAPQQGGLDGGLIVGVIVLLLIVGAGYFWMSGKKKGK